jgi:uncharacterized membrane protein
MSSDQDPVDRAGRRGRGLLGIGRLADHVEGVVQPGLRAAHKLGEAVEGEVLVPAWRRVTRGEPRWPVAIGVLCAIGMQLALPARVTFQHQWVLPGVELAMLTVLIVANPGRIELQDRQLRLLSMALIGTISVANAISAGRLIASLLRGGEEDAGPLLLIGGAIWLTNVIAFSLWYWEFDRGGPVARAAATHAFTDFLFPQMQNPELAPPDWEPTYVDYLYLSFTNATAFSPTDVLPLTRWAKMTMLTQSAISLATVALVIARAVNILK